MNVCGKRALLGLAFACGVPGCTGKSGPANAPAPAYYSTNRDEFLGASRCAGLGLALCEDFEASSFDASTWTLVGQVAPALDTSRAARGAQSAHFHADGNGHSYLQETRTFPAPNNSFWGRMFVYIDALPVTPDDAHFTLVEAAGTGNGSMVREGGQYRKFGAGTDGGPSGDWTNIDADPVNGVVQQVPEKSWVCVEWEYSGALDETHFFWDGVEHPTLATSENVAHGGNSSVPYDLPEFSSIWFGWWMYQANPTPDHYDVWLDEIALDGARIGCSR
ncbi:MAG TPA: hypothetical protein VGM29_09750 [Polyangiaceae bacterium]|jgi:hypothetical protein